MAWFLIALASAFLSSAAAITQKKVLFNLSPLRFSFILSLFNVLISFPFLYAINFAALTPGGIIFLVVKNAIGVFAFLSVMTALKNLEISNALPLLALTPGLVAITGFFILGEKLKDTEIFGLILLICGTYILESNNKEGMLNPFKTFIKSKYHHYILLALVLFTCSSIMDKQLLKDFKLPPLDMTIYQNILFTIFFGIIVLFKKEERYDIFDGLNKNIVGWLILIAIFTFGYRFTQFEAIKIAPAVALVLAIKRTSVFWATIIGGRIFKDKNLLKKTVAVTIIVIGTMLILKD